AADAAAGAIDVKADALRPVLILQVQELHYGQIGRGIVDNPLEEDDPVLEEQVAQGHLPLPGVVAVALQRRIRERIVKGHGTVLGEQYPGDRSRIERSIAEGRGRGRFTITTKLMDGHD